MKNKFKIADKVYLKTDPEQHACIVVAIIVEPGEVYSYRIKFGIDASEHYEIELSSTKTILT